VPDGSNAARIRANSARSAAVRASGSHCAFNAPMPCSAEMEPPSEATNGSSAFSWRPSAAPPGTMFTCRLPSATWPKVMTTAAGSTAVITAAACDASRTHCAAGTETSSLIGMPISPAASGCRSR
jgi:hypothetical protein